MCWHWDGGCWDFRAHVMFCLRRGFASFFLASAFCYRSIGVAPVRGGTYFSLQRQRKVGKRKPLQTSGARQQNASAYRS
ncbi:hypothetical protein PSAB6_190194 [Paraburkholderia sabiae]|nr:hypothetical protein PSAB6_190194 [Paraburkholderia sabiae]